METGRSWKCFKSEFNSTTSLYQALCIRGREKSVGLGSLGKTQPRSEGFWKSLGNEGIDEAMIALGYNVSYQAS